MRARSENGRGTPAARNNFWNFSAQGEASHFRSRLKASLSSRRLR